MDSNYHQMGFKSDVDKLGSNCQTRQMYAFGITKKNA